MELGAKQIAVTWIDVDDEEAERIVLVDNLTSDAAWWDKGKLAERLDWLAQTAKGLAGSGADPKYVETLKAKLAKDATAPLEFPAYDLNIKTNHSCPKCGYEWSGSTSVSKTTS
jgi:hypothetical protein